MKSLSALAALALLAAASAPGSAATRKSGVAADPNRAICKSRPQVGSRVKRVRECHTAAEWDDMKLAEQVGLGRQQINTMSGQSSEELNMIGRIEAAQQPQ
ncbi:MAG TPA: hypothetical protein VF718_02520 [Allosphingosinicella sp.]|jgi:hypothetical protein